MLDWISTAVAWAALTVVFVAGCDPYGDPEFDAIRISNDTDLILTISVDRLERGLSDPELGQVSPGSESEFVTEPCPHGARFVATDQQGRVVAVDDPGQLDECNPERVWTISD